MQPPPPPLPHPTPFFSRITLKVEGKLWIILEQSLKLVEIVEYRFSLERISGN